MKIAIISSFAGSLLNFRGPLIAEMVERGYEVLALAPDHDDATRSGLARLGAQPVDYRLSRGGTNPLQDMAALVGLVRILRKHRPDVSFAYFVKPVIYGTLAARLAGVKRRYAMIEGMGFAFTSSEGQGWRHKALQTIVTGLLRLSLTYATKLLLLNPDDRNEFLDRRLVRADKTALLGGIGVDLNEWGYSTPATDPITFLFVGRLLRDKGVEDYVAAARLVKKEHPTTRFFLVGGHDLNPAALPLSLAESWVAEGVIEWPGHVPVQPWFARASVFVLPSYREGVPRSTQEALAVGLPVITTDVPGCRETVVDGVNGMLVPLRNPDALAEAMRFFVKHPEKIVPMGIESRKIACERFDVHRQNQKLLEHTDL